MCTVRVINRHSTIRLTNMGTPDRTLFMGHVSDVAAAINDLDLVVCASHVEPFGMCVIEAMACEKAVVATRVGGIPEIIEHGVTGLLVAAKSPLELAVRCRRLGRNVERRRRMGEAARDQVKEHFAQDVYVTKMLSVYRSVVSQTQASARH